MANLKLKTKNSDKILLKKFFAEQTTESKTLNKEALKSNKITMMTITKTNSNNNNPNHMNNIRNTLHNETISKNNELSIKNNSSNNNFKIE